MSTGAYPRSPHRRIFYRCLRLQVSSSALSGINSSGDAARTTARLAEDADGDLVYTFSRPWSDGTTGIQLSPLELLEKLAALVPLPRVHLVRCAGCLAPHSALREAIIPTPRQQGVGVEEAKTRTPSWNWARLLGRVFALDMATCPFCRGGSLRIMAALTQESVITRILRHCKLTSVPPPIAFTRLRQETFDWIA
jgi:hypothetical protein